MMYRICRYDGFFNDLFTLIPKSESSLDMPKSKPICTKSIQECVKKIKTAPEETIKEIARNDCSEAFSTLIQIYKNNEYSMNIREVAINTVYDNSRGLYGGLIRNVQLMLLEYCMKIFVKFSLSSMPVSLS